MSDFAKNGEKWSLARIQNFSTFLHFICSFLAIFHKKSENLGKKGHFWLFLALFGGFWGFSSSLGGRDRGPSKMVILAKNGGTPPLPPKPQFSKKHCFLHFFGLARIQNFLLASETEFFLTGLLTGSTRYFRAKEKPLYTRQAFFAQGRQEIFAQRKKGAKNRLFWGFWGPFLASVYEARKCLLALSGEIAQVRTPRSRTTGSSVYELRGF